MSRKTTCIVASAALAALISGGAFSDDRTMGTELGYPLDASAPVDRVININGNTKSVNVVQDENVKFIAGGKSFSWHFATNRFTGTLKNVAPAGAVDHDVVVYLAPNPYNATGD